MINHVFIKLKKKTPHLQMSVKLYHYRYFKIIKIVSQAERSDTRTETGESMKTITQCTAMQNAIAFALIRLGNTSDNKTPGTGPAPREYVKTNLHRKLMSKNQVNIKFSFIKQILFHIS